VPHTSSQKKEIIRSTLGPLLGLDSRQV